MKHARRSLWRRIAIYCGALVASWFISLLRLTLRLHIRGTEHAVAARKGPALFVGWHGRLFPVLFMTKEFGRPTVLVSHSNDGELLSQILKRRGCDIVRGSSSRGGSAARRELVDVLSPNGFVFLTADGPRGPIHRTKHGAIIVAAQAQAVIVPMAASCNRAKFFRRSWDRFMLPMPFSRVELTFGEAFHLPAQISADEAAHWADKIDERLNQMERRLDRQLGLTP